MYIKVEFSGQYTKWAVNKTKQYDKLSNKARQLTDFIINNVHIAHYCIL